MTISKCMKMIAAASSFIGVFLALFVNIRDSSDTIKALMYFTVQSNIFLCITEVLMLAARDGSALHSRAAHLLYHATVSITLTFMVFVLMLAPFLPNAWALGNLLTHVIAPVAAICDFLFFDRTCEVEKNQVPRTTIFPYLYFLFTIVAYLCRWEFFGGKCYPYPFVNYGGSAGVFGFSTDTSDSLFLGSFYWVVILSLFVLGVAALYRSVHNQRVGDRK